MTTPRSLANQKLYHARILAHSWRREMQAESIPATVLAEAFDRAARDHLRIAERLSNLPNAVEFENRLIKPTGPDSLEINTIIEPARRFGVVRQLRCARFGR